MPTCGHSTAPKFDPTQPRELRRYFDELDMLFAACSITDSDQMKRHACRYLDIDSAELWESVPEFATGISFNTFRTAIHKLYPGSENDRKWSILDMDKLVGEQLRVGIFDASDLGMYYRSFYNITQFLRTKNRISEAEQSRAFVRGFQPGLWTRIERRLELKLPDHYPDDPYNLEEIHEAAKFVLAGSSTSHPTPHQQSTATSSQPVPSTSEPHSHIKSEDLTMIFERFAATIATALAAPKQPGQPRNNPPPRQEVIDALVCIFCGLTGHFISKCLTCQDYIAKGKCKKNANGKVVLPNGQFTPRNIPGRFIKERIDEWHRRNPEAPAVPALMYGIAPSPPSTPTPKGVYHVASLANNAEDRIAALEREIFALRSGKPFSRPASNQAAMTSDTWPSSSRAPSEPVVQRPTNTPSALSTVTNHTTSTSTPPSSSASIAEIPSPASTSSPPIHPYAAAKENSYLPPHERNFAGPSKGKEREDRTYHTQAPIQNDKIASEIFSRSMKTPVVTLTSEELLSLSPEVRSKWKEQVTSKRVPLVRDNMPAEPSCNTEIFLADPYETYLNALGPGDEPEPFVVAKESNSIRSVVMDINGKDSVESVVDGGSAIVAMAEAVCHELTLCYDPAVTIPMQSANGGIDHSLGLARNIPCEIGNITLYMQIHIIRNPAYDILLGRPFDVLTESVIRNYRNEAQTITICDPNSSRTATIPTIPRSHRRRTVFRK
jgi:hypothetical protein